VANEEHVAAQRKQGTQSAEAPRPRQAPRAASARRRGALGRARDAVTGFFRSLRPPRLDWRTVLYGLLVLIALILIARNWAPVCIDLFGWHIYPPAAVAFIIFFILGILGAWLWELKSQRAEYAAPAEPAQPASEEQSSDEDEVAV
jgi:uncharacterized integral membrane protein